ncbi:DUF3566 domain-containing protein [Bifidobacterium ramosum]|nr:DUF3566 domain-containing protein [Bifidobacterium ramosum]
MAQPEGFAPEGAAPSVPPAVEPAGEPRGHEHIGRVARSASSSHQGGKHEDNKPGSPASVPPSSRPGRRNTPRARRMNLSLTHISAWSMAKVSFLLSIAGGIIQVIAVALIWVLLNTVGVFEQITEIVTSTGLNLDAGGFDLASVMSLPTVLSATTIFAIVEVVIFTLLVTILTLLYNVVTALVGGVHVTLGDD